MAAIDNKRHTWEYAENKWLHITPVEEAANQLLGNKENLMPITFHFRPELNLVISVHKGDRTDDELLAAYKGMYESDLYNISMNRLADFRQALSSSRSSSALKQLAALANKKFAGTNAHPKVAVIAPNDLSFGISRMYAAYADTVPWDLMVFRSVDAALAWLGLPDDFMDKFENETQQNAPE